MIPLEVIACLASPCIPVGPILLDGVLSAGLGGKMGAARADKWADPVEVQRAIRCGGLPLARVERAGRWWYCASHAVPEGRESLRHLHKRIPQTLLERYTSAKNVNIATGVDKSLRLPQYLRPDWLTVRWSCVGDPDGVADLLWRVGGVGKVTTHGNGWVREWRLSTGQVVAPFQSITQGEAWGVCGPDRDAYAQDLTLRHLPVEAVEALPPGRVRRRLMPLQPPYHTGYDEDASRAVPCWQLGGA